MLRPALLALLMLWGWGGMPAPVLAGDPPADSAPLAENEEFYDPWDDDPWSDDPWDYDPWDDDPCAAGKQTLADPLEPLNRVFFTFNDRLYIWVLDPTARGYARVLPEDIRLTVRRFFRNLKAPVRVVNHLLQGQVRDSGRELTRFAVNSTIGIAGLADPAADSFGLKQKNADLGQTLGIYGFGGGFYIIWPVLGPSSLRDSLGMAGDSLVDPLAYLRSEDPRAGAAAHGWQVVNNTSFYPGEYEGATKAAFDPYIAIRNAYWQYRCNQVRGLDGAIEAPGVFGVKGDPGRAERVEASPVETPPAAAE